MELTQNMRVAASGDPELEEFDTWTVSLGDGTAPVVGVDNLVQLKEELCTEIDPDRQDADMRKFCEEIYPQLEKNYSDETYLEGRAILAPTNRKVDVINDFLTSKLPGAENVLLSADQLTEEEDPFRFSVEYLNNLNPTGLPRHRLVLKAGQPLMLLRNLNPKKGLCNGSRLTFVRVLSNRLLECRISGEQQNRRTVLIPRVTLRPKEGQYGFDWARRQFPGR